MGMAISDRESFIRQYEDGYFTNAISDRVVSDLRAHLKGQIMPAIEAEVDAAVEAVLKELAPQLKTAFTRFPQDMVAQLLVEVKTRHLKAEHE